MEGMTDILRFRLALDVLFKEVSIITIFVTVKHLILLQVMTLALTRKNPKIPVDQILQALKP